MPPARLGTIAALLGGAFLGILVSVPFSYELSLRSGKAQLLSYTQRILRVLEKAAVDNRDAELTLYRDQLPFCSEAEINLMRKLVYNSSFVREMGRSKDGMIYCTAARGMLPKPLAVAPPSVSYRSHKLGLQIGIAVDQGPLIAPGLRGMVIDIQGVSSVVNLALLEGMDEGPLHGGGFVQDPDHGLVVPLFGDTGKLSNADVLANRPLQRDGVIYQPLCSINFTVCVVGSVRQADLLSNTRRTLGAFSLFGAIVGALMASTLLLLVNRERSLSRRLLRAVRKGELRCVYQPVVDLDTQAVIGAEALVRWVSRSGDSVSPEVFIRVAEERRFVGEITRLVIDRVIDEMGPLLYVPGFRVAINISSRDLLDPQFFAHLEQSTAWTGIRPNALAFELTEHSTADHATAANAIGRLRAAGHAIYIDDFGTGYSSLAYLHDLQVDAIKIDKAFTRTVGTEAVTASVVPQILTMADRLGLTVIVEGIETAEQAGYFCRLRSGLMAQGWHFGMPMTAVEFIEMFQAQKPSSRMTTTAR